MNKRIISNEEFIELWNVHKSAAKIAKLTGDFRAQRPPPPP
jgi:hypothetical protein